MINSTNYNYRSARISELLNYAIVPSQTLLEFQAGQPNFLKEMECFFT